MPVDPPIALDPAPLAPDTLTPGAGAGGGVGAGEGAARSGQRWREYLYLSGTALQMVVAACITPILTRVIGPGPFGRVAAAMAVMQILFCFECLGLSVGVQRVHAEGPDGVRRSSGLQTLALGSATALTLVLLTTVPLWGGTLGFGGALDALRVTVVWGGVSSATAVFMARLRSEDRVVWFGAVSICQGLLGNILGLGAVLLWSRTATIYLAGLLAGQVLALALGMAASPPTWTGVLARRRTLLVLAFTLPLIPEQLAGFVLNTSDRLVIQHHLGPVAVGRYSLSYNLAATGATLLVLFNLVWLPTIFSAQGQRRIDVLARTRDQLLRLGLPAMLGIALGAPAVLTVWAPSSFDPKGLVTTTMLIALATLPTIVYASEYRVMVAAGRTAAVAGATGVAAVVNFVLNLALVPHLGVNGSALATVVAYTSLAGCAHWLSVRTTPLPRVSGRLLLWCGAAVCLTGASALMPAGGAWFAVRLVTGSMCLVPLAGALRASGELAPGTPGAPAGGAGPRRPAPLALAGPAGDRAAARPQGRLAVPDVLRRSPLVPLAALGAVLAITRSSSIDDAYITYRYSANLLAGHGLVFNVGQRVEGLSDPLWAFLLAGAHLCGLPFPIAGYLLGVATLVGVVLLARVAGRQAGLSPGAVTLLATGVALPVPLVASATMGLEGGLMALLLLVLVCTWHHGGRAAGLFAVAAVALALTRPEGLLIAGGMAVLNAAMPPRRRDESLAGAAVLAGLVAIEVARHAYYGKWLPNSVTAKRDIGVPLLTDLRAKVPPGIKYDILALRGAWLVGGLIVGAWLWRRYRHHDRRSLPADALPAGVLGAVGVLLPIASGGDWMPYGRLVAPYLPVIFIFLVAVSRTLTGPVLRVRPVLPVILALATTPWVLPLQSGGTNPLSTERPFDDVGRALVVTDLHGGSVATDVLGRMSFWAPDLEVSDLYGLTDPVIAEHPGPSSTFGKLDLPYSASLDPVIVATNFWPHVSALAALTPGRYVAVTGGGLVQAKVFLLAQPKVAAGFARALDRWFPGSAVEPLPAALATWRHTYPSGQ